MMHIIGALVVVDGLLLITAWSMGGAWVVNTQVAYLTSALIMGASMFSYARMVHGRLESGAIPDMDDRDMIDKMEDPYGLYDDTSAGSVTESASTGSATETIGTATAIDSTDDEHSVTEPAEIKDAIKKEKQRMKKQRRTPMQTLRDSRAAMSIYRLGAYGALLFGFFYLRGNELFEPMPYLVGLGLPIVVIVVMLMMRKEPSA